MKVCKGKWLQSHIPYLELQDLLMDQQLGLTQATPGSNTQVGFKYFFIFYLNITCYNLGLVHLNGTHKFIICSMSNLL